MPIMRFGAGVPDRPPQKGTVMKPKLTIGLSILISLLLLAFGLVYGDVNGYADDRAGVVSLLGGPSGLADALGYRAADGLNLCVVAERHLTADTDVAALRGAALAQRETSANKPAALKAGDDTLAAAFATVAAKLRATDSFTASERDTRYLAMLAADFAQYGQSDIYQTYNQAVEQFNQKLNVPVLGDVARFFGVKPCEAYR